MSSRLFWEIWGEHEKWLYRSIYASVRNHVDAEDILHDTLIKAVIGYEKLRDRQKVKAWLSSIAAYTIADHFRRKNHEQLWAAESFDRVIHQYEGISEDKLIIEEFLDALPADWRSIVLMNLYYQISARRISEITGGSFQAIRRRLTRTYHLLRKSLSVYEVDND